MMGDEQCVEGLDFALFAFALRGGRRLGLRLGGFLVKQRDKMLNKQLI